MSQDGLSKTKFPTTGVEEVNFLGTPGGGGIEINPVGAFYETQPVGDSSGVMYSSPKSSIYSNFAIYGSAGRGAGQLRNSHRPFNRRHLRRPGRVHRPVRIAQVLRRPERLRAVRHLRKRRPEPGRRTRLPAQQWDALRREHRRQRHRRLRAAPPAECRNRHGNQPHLDLRHPHGSRRPRGPGTDQRLSLRIRDRYLLQPRQPALFARRAILGRQRCQRRTQRPDAVHHLPLPTGRDPR